MTGNKLTILLLTSFLVLTGMFVGTQTAKAAPALVGTFECKLSATGAGPDTLCSVSPAAAGNAYVLTWGASTNTAAITSVSGGGVTWIKAVSSVTNRDDEIWYALNSPSTGGGLTITWTGGSVSYQILITEWSGLPTSGNVIDGVASASGNNITVTTGTLNTTNAGDLLIATERNQTGTFSSGPTNSFLNLGTASAGSSANAYLVPGVVGNYFTTWNNTSTLLYDSAIVAFGTPIEPSAPPIRHQVIIISDLPKRLLFENV